MVDRITITKITYLQLDGQWQIVLPGSTIDVPSAAAFHSSTSTIVSTNTGTLGAHGKPTSVSSVRTR